MKTIEKLLGEYKIRFKETERIKEDGYPFTHRPLNEGNTTPSVSVFEIFNSNGKVYHYGNVWATAKITEKPEKWVVEKDEEHPMWERFKKWLINEKEYQGSLSFRYFSNKSMADFLNCFEEHQYLTLDQWAELFLDEPKVGDWCVFWNSESFYRIERFVELGASGTYPYVAEYGADFKHCQKLSPELSEMLEKEINQIKNK